MASLVGEVKPYVPTWRPPVKVNPLIRAARWGALISGVVYGYWRHNSLKDMAQCEREDYLSRQVSHALVKRNSLQFLGWSGVKWVTFSNVFLISRNLLTKWRILWMVMAIVCFLYYHEKGNCLQKDLCRGQPSFLWTGKWPILPHPGGVKWVTYFFFNNIHNFFISSDQFLRISKKRIVLYFSWAKSIVKWQILLSFE